MKGLLRVHEPFPLPLPFQMCALSSLHPLLHLLTTHTRIHSYYIVVPLLPSLFSLSSLSSSLSSQDSSNQLESVSCREGMYVRVVGHLRSFNKQRNMMAFHVRPVEDFNEVSHHLSEVIYTHLAVTKGLPVVSWLPLPSNH